MTGEGMPPVRGLLMAGGFSRRMGQDKALIAYHGEPQAVVAWRLLTQVCGQAWVSLRADQVTQAPYVDLPSIVDEAVAAGPMRGVLSAFKQDPNAAWLVLACDLPGVTEEMLRQLLATRQSGTLATAFVAGGDASPEPLCAVYEPEALPVLQERAAAGRYSLRQFLQAHPVSRLVAPSPQSLANVNAPTDWHP
jgi:molybdopterin-guanine dinucleotide biosynthesis protein A